MHSLQLNDCVYLNVNRLKLHTIGFYPVINVKYFCNDHMKIKGKLQTTSQFICQFNFLYPKLLSILLYAVCTLKYFDTNES